MAARIDLTGWRYADLDRALYFLRHLDDDRIFWTEMRGRWGFRPETEFTNVFHGTFDPGSNIIAAGPMFRVGLDECIVAASRYR